MWKQHFYRDVDEEIYMGQPIGFEVKDNSTEFASSNDLYMASNNHLGNVH